MAMQFTPIQEAIARAKRDHGITVEVRNDYLRGCVMLSARDDEGFAISKNVEHWVAEMHGVDEVHEIVRALLNERIKRGAAAPSEDFKRKYAEVQAELAKYKAAVKSLAFQLEMQQSSGGGAVLVESEVRKYALAQAAELVMDWGIPQDGHDLAKLCEQITKIPREKGLPDDKAA